MKKILLIEDDNGVREAISYALGYTGYDVAAYANGEKLLSGAFANPDLFIIDKQLSGVDGIELCKHLRHYGQYDKIPIILISASPQAGRLAKGLDNVHFLEKPFPLIRLQDMVAEHLQ